MPKMHLLTVRKITSHTTNTKEIQELKEIIKILELKKSNGVTLSYMNLASIIMESTNAFLNYLIFQHKYQYLHFHHLLKMQKAFLLVCRNT
jgi:hypothetical protein